MVLVFVSDSELKSRRFESFKPLLRIYNPRSSLCRIKRRDVLISKIDVTLPELVIGRLKCLGFVQINGYRFTVGAIVIAWTLLQLAILTSLKLTNAH